MALKNKIGSKQDLEIKDKKFLYEPPQLIRFGLVKDLTTAASIAPKAENSGNDGKNNCRRQGDGICRP